MAIFVSTKPFRVIKVIHFNANNEMKNSDWNWLELKLMIFIIISEQFCEVGLLVGVDLSTNGIITK